MPFAQFQADLQAIVDDAGNNFDAQDKQNMEQWGPQACAIQAELRQLALKCQTLREMWNNGVSTSVQRLANNTSIANPTGLQGTNDIVHTTDADSDWVNMQTYMNVLLEGSVDLSAASVLATMVPAAGINVQG